MLKGFAIASILTLAPFLLLDANEDESKTESLAPSDSGDEFESVSDKIVSATPDVLEEPKEIDSKGDASSVVDDDRKMETIGEEAKQDYEEEKNDVDDSKPVNDSSTLSDVDDVKAPNASKVIDDPETEIASLEEFKQRKLQEEEENKKKNNGQGSDGGGQPINNGVKANRKKLNNYASVDCGAEVIATNPEASKPGDILQENKDAYMLNPCSVYIWFIVKLCDIVRVSTIEIANFELFASTPESFQVFTSERYPTEDWVTLGTFHAREEKSVQSFPLEDQVYARFIKVELLSHFGSQHYCPISLFRVLGTSMVEEYEDQETEKSDGISGTSKAKDNVLVIESPDFDDEDADWSDGIINSVIKTLSSSFSPGGIYNYFTRLFRNGSNEEELATNETKNLKESLDSDENVTASSLDDSGEIKASDEETPVDVPDSVGKDAVPLPEKENVEVKTSQNGVEDAPIHLAPSTDQSHSEEPASKSAFQEAVNTDPQPVDERSSTNTERLSSDSDAVASESSPPMTSNDQEEVNHSLKPVTGGNEQMNSTNGTEHGHHDAVEPGSVEVSNGSSPSPTTADSKEESANLNNSRVAFDVDNVTDDAAASNLSDDTPAMAPHLNQQGNQKESVFIRLGNKIKNLEANLSLISTYLDELGYSLKKFKKNSSEALRTADKRLTELNESQCYQQDIIAERITLLVAIQGRLLEVTEEMQKEWLLTKTQFVYVLAGVFAILFAAIFGFLWIVNKRLKSAVETVKRSQREQDVLKQALLRLAHGNGTVRRRQVNGDDGENRIARADRKLGGRDLPVSSVHPKDSGYIDTDSIVARDSNQLGRKNIDEQSSRWSAVRWVQRAFFWRQPAPEEQKEYSRLSAKKGLSPETKRALKQSKGL
ncbi:SUN domain-containing ossification factor-like isoform X2 [Oscarella lobularis]|uniref:SUN domain-containing ossification factor-like isoform X2 n=1 Tax=Oscarella lobularis TaxID=121494 RepID=UPI00331346A0